MKQSLSQELKFSTDSTHEVADSTTIQEIKNEEWKPMPWKKGMMNYNDVFDLDNDGYDEWKQKQKILPIIGYWARTIPRRRRWWRYKTRAMITVEENDRTTPVAVENAYDMLNRQLGMMGLDSLKLMRWLPDKSLAQSMKMDTSDAAQCHQSTWHYVQSGAWKVSKEDVYRHTGVWFQDLIHQVLEPRDLRECLILQLQDKMDKSGDHSRPRTLAMKILVDYFEGVYQNTIKT